MAGLNNILWDLMADVTVSAVMAGLTNVMWEPIDDLTDSPILL